jgi:hypothetical protein
MLGTSALATIVIASPVHRILAPPAFRLTESPSSTSCSSISGSDQYRDPHHAHDAILYLSGLTARPQFWASLAARHRIKFQVPSPLLATRFLRERNAINRPERFHLCAHGFVSEGRTSSAETPHDIWSNREFALILTF